MNLSSQIKTLIETQLQLIPNVYIETGSNYKGKKNRTEVIIITDYPEEVDDEGNELPYENLYMAFEIRISDVIDKDDDETALYNVCDEYRIALKKMGYNELTDYVGALGTIKSKFKNIIIDQLIKPVNFGNSIGFAIYGKAKLFLTII